MDFLLDAVAADAAVIRPDEATRFEQLGDLVLGFGILGGQTLRVDVEELLGADKFSGAVAFGLLVRCKVQMVIRPAALDIFARSGSRWLSTSSASTWTMQPRSNSSRSSR